MTRDEFIHYAQTKVNMAVDTFRTSMWNLVERAWIEGQRNAETEMVTEIVNSAIMDACKRINEQEESGNG